jgi:hypothetical protein
MGTLHDGGVGLFIYSLIKGHNHHLPPLRRSADIIARASIKD